MTQPLTDAITALTRYANETTGADDPDLSSAVRTLCDGYGQGGGFTADEIATHSFTGDIVLTTTTKAVSRAFAESKITSIYSETLQSLSINMLSDCPNLISVDFPNVTDAYAATYVFANSPRLANVNLPKLTRIWTFAFQGCSSLEHVKFPSLGTVQGGGLFNGCSSLESADFSVCTQLNAGSNFSGTKLKTLVIRTPSVCTIGNINSFTNSPFASGGTGGTLYVPQALISSYQSANNWSTILGYANNQILPIEGSIYETQYADGTPIE